jgi:zinc transport system substrate-binding protein
MWKKWISLFVCCLFVLSFSGCDSSSVDEGTISVCVSFDAMKEFAEAVGGDKVEITTIIPDGTEPHDFEPDAQDLVSLSSAQVFIYNGLGMEKWADDAVSAADNENLIVVEASDGVTPIELEDPDEIAEHGEYDPHTWLSLKAAETEVTNIKDAFVEADPDNAEYYEENCASFISQLEDLYEEYEAKFQTVTQKSFVTGHAAFGYLCRDFGLEQNSVEDVFADGEPSAQQLAELVEYCRENDVTTIFAEELASPEVSETLADEVGAEVETIYTIASAEDDKTYLERMEENLEKIYQSLID